jgi:nitrite reductase/ring-hydroxylating ferredoxin subunit
MAEFVKVATMSELASSGQSKVVELGGRSIAIFNCNGELYAIDNICSHRGGPLGEGLVNCQAGTVQCPWHGWSYTLSTGESTVSSLFKVERFDLRVEGDDIAVSLE